MAAVDTAVCVRLGGGGDASGRSVGCAIVSAPPRFDAVEEAHVTPLRKKTVALLRDSFA